jgi:hypothetical protein
MVLSVTTKLLGSPFCVPVCLPGRSVFSVYFAISLRILHSNNKLELPLSSCAIGIGNRDFFCFLPDDPILNELLEILSVDCLNFGIPDYLVQPSALSVHHPEGWEEMNPVSTKKLLSSLHFPSNLLSLT